MKEKNVWCSILYKLKKGNQNQIKNKKKNMKSNENVA